MLSRTVALAALVSLSACAGPAGPCNVQEAIPLPPADDACHAAEFGRYRGALPTADVMAAIGDRVGERNLRTIRPGDAVTMDFRPDRLNVELGDDGRIKRLRCG